MMPGMATARPPDDIPDAGRRAPRAVWPLWARAIQLLVGLVLFGGSAALQVRSGLGLGPWDVLHQGLSRQTGLAIGTWSIMVGAVVLLLWIPLRQWPGVGTVCNVVLVGLSLDAVLDLVSPPHGLPARWAFLLAGILLNGVATGAYIGAALGPGPRDGLMVGLGRRGHSIRVVRTGIELAVLAAGFVLGGTVGVGTVLYAVFIGPLAHVTIPAFSHGPAPAGDRHGPWASRLRLPRRPRRLGRLPRPEEEVPCASA
jgi:uncharacterized membrane protein YczE